MDYKFRYFEESVDLSKHPLRNVSSEMKANYYGALSYVINQCITPLGEDKSDSRYYIQKRLLLYAEDFCPQGIHEMRDAKAKQLIASFFRVASKKKYRFSMVCDLVYLLGSDDLVSAGMDIIEPLALSRRKKEAHQILNALQSQETIPKRFAKDKHWIDMYRKNRELFSMKERRILVTANMSAGKSTLINALIGKPIARTAQSACTGSICYLRNKPFEDGHIHLFTDTLDLNASGENLQSYEWGDDVSIATHFSSLVPINNRICIIDTPGVDAALHREHSRMTHTAIENEECNLILYVVSPTKLGTDAEKKHLQWVASHLGPRRIIFVLNKLDDYKRTADSVDESIAGLMRDLIEAGFSEPVICPISAYFSLLLKMKMSGQTLTEDEEDEYQLYAKKFRRPEHDLTRFYPEDDTELGSEELMLCKKSGLYGLEKIIYGGRI